MVGKFNKKQTSPKISHLSGKGLQNPKSLTPAEQRKVDASATAQAAPKIRLHPRKKSR